MVLHQAHLAYSISIYLAALLASPQTSESQYSERVDRQIVSVIIKKVYFRRKIRVYFKLK